MKLRTPSFAIVFGGVALLGVPTNAATFGFSFDITGEDYTGNGTFDGDLQGNGDTILNMKDLSVTYTTGGNRLHEHGQPVVRGWRLKSPPSGRR